MKTFVNSQPSPLTLGPHAGLLQPQNLKESLGANSRGNGLIWQTAGESAVSLVASTTSALSERRNELKHRAEPCLQSLSSLPGRDVFALIKKHIIPCSNPDPRAILQPRRLARQQRARQPEAVPAHPHPAAAPFSLIVPKANPTGSVKDFVANSQHAQMPNLCSGTASSRTTCHLAVLEHFSNSVKRRKHTRSCKQMPYKMWLARVKRTQQAVTVSDHPCPICRVKFWAAHAKGRHSVVCKQRRDAEHK